MSPEIFMIAFLLGSAALALWVDAVFPQLAPSDLRRALFRTGVALGLTMGLFPPIWDAAVARGPVLVALFTIALPCLTALLLSAIWSIRQLQGAISGPAVGSQRIAETMPAGTRNHPAARAIATWTSAPASVSGPSRGKRAPVQSASRAAPMVRAMT